MDADNKFAQQAIEPIQVTVIGGGTGAGTGTGTGDGTRLITTPPGQPNVIARFVTPLLAITLRFAYTFGTTWSGLIGAGMTTNLIPAKDFMELAWKCAVLSVAGAAFGAIKDFVVIVGRLKDKYPLADV